MRRSLSTSVAAAAGGAACRCVEIDTLLRGVDLSCGAALLIGLDVSFTKFGLGIISVFPDVAEPRILRAKTLETDVMVPPKSCTEFVDRAIFYEDELQKRLDKALMNQAAGSRTVVSIEANIPHIAGRGQGMMVVSQMNAIVKFQMAKRFGSANVFSSMPRSARRGFGVPTGLTPAALKKHIQSIVAGLDPSIVWKNNARDGDVADAFILALHGIRLLCAEKIKQDPALKNQFEVCLFKEQMGKDTRTKTKARNEHDEKLEKRVTQIVDEHFHSRMLPVLFKSSS